MKISSEDIQRIAEEVEEQATEVHRYGRFKKSNVADEPQMYIEDLYEFGIWGNWNDNK